MTSSLATPSEHRGQAAIAAAAQAIRSGGLAIIPTETVYGLAADASNAAAVAKLHSLIVPPELTPALPPASSWHAATADRVIQTLKVTHPLHLRIFKKLIPGPIRLMIEKTPEDIASILSQAGIAPGIIDRKNEIWVRVPDNALAQAVLEQAGGICIADRISAYGLGDGRELPDNITEAAGRMGISAILDDGPTRLGKPSTPVRLGLDGSFDVLPGGQLDERYIRKKIERLVVFVCTGNTCRSPMAEAIARDVLGRTKTQIPTRVVSAGVSAMPGEPMTREAREALKELDVDAGSHRSRDLSRDLLNDAEVIFAMTRSHMQAIVDIAPGVAGKVFVIDPSGQDVKDPIGGTQDEYRSTARKLKELVERRLADLEKPSSPKP